MKEFVLNDFNHVTVRIVLEGDTSVVYDEISTLAWIRRIDAIRSGDRSVWTVVLQGTHPSPTDLLRVVLADRRLRIVEFSLLSLPEADNASSA